MQGLAQLGNGDSAAGRYWEPVGCPGIPQTTLEEPDLETGLEKPNSRRFCAGLSPNGCWIMFSWVSFMSLSPVLGGHPHLEGAHPHFGRGHLCLGIGFTALPPQLSGGSCVTWWFCCALFLGDPRASCGGGGAGSCAELPHVLSLSSAPTSPRWPRSLCSCQICRLMRVCLSVPALRMLPAPPSLCCSLGCRIGIPRGDRDVFGCIKGACDVPALAFYMFY